jgi:Txe/YoeB family toxin of Txe-Axe toxin-antitoxin module
MKYSEKKTAITDRLLIRKSYPKATQNKLLYIVNDILENPRNKETVGNPEELKYAKKEIWSRELTKKDRIVYGIEPISVRNLVKLLINSNIENSINLKIVSPVNFFT